jgi:hypothetical protein
MVDHPFIYFLKTFHLLLVYVDYALTDLVSLIPIRASAQMVYAQVTACVGLLRSITYINVPFVVCMRANPGLSRQTLPVHNESALCISNPSMLQSSHLTSQVYYWRLGRSSHSD